MGKKIIKTVAIRCQILTLKCTKIDFGWGSIPDPLGSLQYSPRLRSWNKEDLLLREGRGAERKRRKGRRT